MKKITILLIGCSLGLAGAVLAQQPEGQESPTKKGGRAEATPQAAQAKPKATAGEMKPKSKTAESKPTPEAKTPETGATPREKRGMLGGRKEGPSATSPPATTPTRATASATPTGKAAEQGKKGRKAREEAKAPTSATPAAGAAASATPAASAPPAASATAATSPAGAAGTKTAAQGTVGRGGKKVEAQQIQQIKQQHASFKAQPKPNVAPSVTFDANRRIEGSQQWQGPQYEVFRSYHPEWHDQAWYRSHFTRVELIAGGWYFWNNGYWFPAWGYDPGVVYYAYDGPIYVGRAAAPPDQVIASVQAELQAMGYYQGEVDGLLGPLTRQALRDYQADHGLIVTEVIDEPTLDALQLS